MFRGQFSLQHLLRKRPLPLFLPFRKRLFFRRRDIQRRLLFKELPERTGNLGHLAWKNPFTDEVSNESFPEVFDRALVDYECTVARFIETGDMDAVTSHVNYSGRVLNADEEFDREE